MIVAAGGEFVNLVWTDEGALVAVDMDGRERVRVAWTGWPNADRVARVAILWDLCAVLLFPRLTDRNARRRLDDASRITPTPPEGLP